MAALLLIGLLGGSADSSRDAVLKAATPQAAGRAYRLLFTAQPRSAISKWKEDPDAGIALQAAWEASHRPIKRHDKMTGWNWVYQPAGAQDFLTFFARRTGITPPDWWAKNILNTEMAPGSGSSCFGPDNPAPAKWSAVGKGFSKFTVAKDSIVVPQERLGFVGSDALFDGSRAYLAVIPLTGPGTLYCYGRKPQKLLWKAEIWATGRMAVNGALWETVSVSRQWDSIAVFGRSGTAYAEVFDSSTGKSRLRFNTSYWENWSERWPWKSN